MFQTPYAASTASSGLELHSALANPNFIYPPQHPVIMLRGGSSWEDYESRRRPRPNAPPPERRQGRRRDPGERAPYRRPPDRDDWGMAPQTRGSRYADSSSDRNMPAAAHILVLGCFIVYVLQHIVRLPGTYLLQLNHYQPRWWQPATSLLCHENQQHLMGNMFNLLIFAKMVEEELGKGGLLASFLTCGVVSNLISLLLLPKNTISVGASGAVFGLYAVSVLTKLLRTRNGLSPLMTARNLIECLVFGWFVAVSLVNELKLVAAGGVGRTNHMAHFAGVAAGACVIFVSSYRKAQKPKDAWD